VRPVRAAIGMRPTRAGPGASGGRSSAARLGRVLRHRRGRARAPKVAAHTPPRGAGLSRALASLASARQGARQSSSAPLVTALDRRCCSPPTPPGRVRPQPTGRTCPAAPGRHRHRPLGRRPCSAACAASAHLGNAAPTAAACSSNTVVQTPSRAITTANAACTILRDAIRQKPRNDLGIGRAAQRLPRTHEQGMGVAMEPACDRRRRLGPWQSRPEILPHAHRQLSEEDLPAVALRRGTTPRPPAESSVLAQARPLSSRHLGLPVQ
jgi:hypothetical protein